MAGNIQTEIEKLKNQIVYLGTAVQENMQKSVKALWEKNPDLARQVIKQDKNEIDSFEINVEEECMRLLALHQPVAGDLRFIVTVLNTTHINAVLKLIGLTTGDRVLATPLATITGLTYNFLPFMTLPLYASLDRVDPRLVEAAGDLYSTPFTAFRKVTLPLSMPGVVAGTLLTFIPAAGDYINQALLGRAGEGMIGNVIDSTFLDQQDYPTAAALSVTLMATIVLLVTLYVWRSGTEELV